MCHYSETKALSEKLAIAANGPELETVVIRPHAIWGPRDHTLFPRIIVRAKQGRLLQIGKGTNEHSLLYVENGVDALVLAATAKAAPGKIYFIVDDKPVVLWEFIRKMLAELKVPAPRRAVPYPVAYALGAVMETAYTVMRLKGEPVITRYVAVKLGKSHSYSSKRARADLGYYPRVYPEEGLRNVYKWIDEKGLTDEL